MLTGSVVIGVLNDFALVKPSWFMMISACHGPASNFIPSGSPLMIRFKIRSYFTSALLLPMMVVCYLELLS